LTGGCSAPQRVIDDIKTLKVDAKALYDFNREFLKRAKSSTPEELEKKMKMVMINEIAYQRTMDGLNLLGEYVGSLEIISNAQLAATEDTINRIADRVKERLSDN
jgi:hypothetical protein